MFSGGMLALGSQWQPGEAPVPDNPSLPHTKLAAELTSTCHESYIRSGDLDVRKYQADNLFNI